MLLIIVAKGITQSLRAVEQWNFFFFFFFSKELGFLFGEWCFSSPHSEGLYTKLWCCKHHATCAE